MSNSTKAPAGATGVSGLKRHRPHPAPAVRLVCFPYAGAGANVYRSWSAVADPRIELLALQAPGREARLGEACAQSADQLVEPVIAELLRDERRTPLALFGHSMGALLAFETALRLRQRHRWPVQALIVSGRQPPHVLYGGDHHLRSDEELLEEIQRIKGTPKAVLADPEMLRMVLPVLRSDYRVAASYRVAAGARVDCPLVVCMSTSDDYTPLHAMEKWQDLAHGPVHRWSFPGGHFYLADQVQTLVGCVNRLLFPG